MISSSDNSGGVVVGGGALACGTVAGSNQSFML